MTEQWVFNHVDVAAKFFSSLARCFYIKIACVGKKLLRKGSRRIFNFSISVCLGFILFFSFPGCAQESSLEERVEFIEAQRNLVKRKGEFYGIAEGELLYWKADIEGTAYETTSVTVPARGGIGTLATRFKTRTPHFSYDPGFRLNVGFQSAYDLFDVCLVWTRFYTKGHDRARGTLVPGLSVPGDKLISSGIGLIQPLISIPNRASVQCDIKENILDLQFGRGITISHAFLLRPYFGVRGLWSDVSWDISIERTFLIPGLFDQDSTLQVVKNDFHAAGGLIGVNVEWKMSYGLGVCGRGAAALVYGCTKEITKQRYILLPSFSSAFSEQTFRAHHSFHSVKGQMELFTGVFWDSRMSKKLEKRKRELIYFRLFAGYEFQGWPWIAQKTNDQKTRQRERFSLGFQGFTGGAVIVF